LTEKLSSDIAAGRESHAYLFHGPPSAGKTTLAFAYARALLCEHRFGCGVCVRCRQVLEGTHVDLVHLHPMLTLKKDEKPGSIKIDHIRELIVQRAPPGLGDRVVVIIESAERMVMPDATDALLKTLEEPPDWMRFVLTTSRSEAMPETILSRTSQVYVGTVGTEAIAKALQDRYSLVGDDAITMAGLSAGLPGRAIQYATGEGARDRAAAITAILEDFAIAAPLDALAISEKLRALAKGGDDEEAETSMRMAQAAVLDTLAVWFRDVMDFAERGEDARPQLPVAAGAAREAAKRGSAAGWRDAVLRALETRNMILGNAQARVQFDALVCAVLLAR